MGFGGDNERLQGPAAISDDVAEARLRKAAISARLEDETGAAISDAAAEARLRKAANIPMWEEASAKADAALDKAVADVARGPAISDAAKAKNVATKSATLAITSKEQKAAANISRYNQRLQQAADKANAKKMAAKAKNVATKSAPLAITSEAQVKAGAKTVNQAAKGLSTAAKGGLIGLGAAALGGMGYGTYKLFHKDKKKKPTLGEQSTINQKSVQA